MGQLQHVRDGSIRWNAEAAPAADPHPFEIGSRYLRAVLDASTRQALAAAETGDVAPLRALRDVHPESTDARVALDAVGYLAGVVPVRPAPLGSASESALELAFVAVVERDAGLLRAALASDAGSDPLRRRAMEQWLTFEERGGGAPLEAIRALETDAARARRAGTVLEMAALRGLVLLSSGQLGEAVAAGRRASRMARTEALRQQEYLANVILARIRRASQRPHLALRILFALRAAVSDPWRDWVDSELLLSGGRIDEGSGRVAGWRTAIAAACAGERGVFVRGLDRLATDPGSTLVREDAAVLRCIVDPEFDPDRGPHGAAAWRRTETDLAPGGLHAVADAAEEIEAGGAGEPPRAAAHVLLYPDGRATRISSLGLGLIGAPWIAQSTGKRRGGRLPAALPVLAAAGSNGLAAEALFAEVYGFRFKKVLHENALGILLHRVRAALDPAARLERGGGRVRLETSTILAVPDARCDRPVEDRLLRLLGQRRGTSAREAAKALGVPLRSAQAVLKELVEDGSCLRDGAGRTTTYLIEDTTFREPTNS